MPRPKEFSFDTSAPTLREGEIVESHEVPSASTLRMMAELSHYRKRELGVLSVKTGEDRYRTLWIVGSRHEILVGPEALGKVEGEAEGVFIHTHPYEPPPLQFLAYELKRRLQGMKERKLTTGIMPSFEPKLTFEAAGDINALWSGQNPYQYLTIATTFGLTLYLGGDPRTPEDDTELEKFWKREELPQEGLIKHFFEISSVGSEQTEKYAISQLVRRGYLPVATDRTMLIRGCFKPESLGNRLFLFLPWEKLYELEKTVFSDMDNLFFGTGLEEIAQHLQLGNFYEIPSHPNLASAVKRRSLLMQ